MTNENKEYNPFEGMDGKTTPEELLQALMKKAIADKDLRPIGGIVGMLQKQVQATMQHLGAVMQRLREEVGQTSMVTDVGRLTTALVIRILIDKGIVTREEFDKLYEEKVTNVMDQHIQDIKKQQEEMLAKQQEEIEKFAKEASEKGEIVDPNSGEVIADGELIEENISDETETSTEDTPVHPSIESKTTKE
jgi:hypothetical protein